MNIIKIKNKKYHHRVFDDLKKVNVNDFYNLCKLMNDNKYKQFPECRNEETGLRIICEHKECKYTFSKMDIEFMKSIYKSNCESVLECKKKIVFEENFMRIKKIIIKYNSLPVLKQLKHFFTIDKKNTNIQNIMVISWFFKIGIEIINRNEFFYLFDDLSKKEINKLSKEKLVFRFKKPDYSKNKDK